MEIVKNKDLGKNPTRELFSSQGPVPKLNPRSHGVWTVSTRFSWDFSRTTAGSGQECLELWGFILQDFWSGSAATCPPLANVDWAPSAAGARGGVKVPAAGRKAHRCAWPRGKS